MELKLPESRQTSEPVNSASRAVTRPVPPAEELPPPFFIVGSGRTGSTLLRMMLAAHSRIAIPPETWFMLPLVQRFSVERPLNAQELNQAIELMTSHYRWSDMEMPAEELRRGVRQLAQPRLADLVGLVYGKHLQGSGKVRWGDKTPPYIQILPQLAAVFPGAKFICLVRDGRDVAKSFQGLRMYGPWLHDNTVEWRDACYWERKWMKSGYSDRILPVRYEDLVTDAEASLRRICEFLGEEFEPRMLTWQEEVGRLVPAREQHVHQKLTRDSRREDVERWKTEMNARETFVAEAFMFGYLDRHGYERRFANPAWIPVFWLVRLYCVLLWPSIPFRAMRWAARRIRQGPSEDDGVRQIWERIRPMGAKMSETVPRAVSWNPRSARGFFR